MSESIEKQLINLLTVAWGETAPALVGTACELSLIAQREAVGADISTALESTSAYPCAFATTCSGALSGVLLYLFKKEDRQQIELFINKMSGAEGVSGIPALLQATLTATAATLPATTTFGAIIPLDLTSIDATAIPAQLVAAAGASAWVNTFTLTIGERLNSQLLVLYAPHGSVAELMTETATAAAAGGPNGFAGKRPAPTPREDPARNIERLLDVELEVVVRFGLTQMPLRELIRIGVGSMIELNRQVDEPVELLVNNRPLARGSVVVVDGYYGVCITEIGQPEERRQSLIRG